jgi:serine/threonine kinase 38
MEYCPGGDLMGLFIARDILKEEDAKFYICEMILAIDSIHELNCIHRDIKPDNVLIGKDGHIKLTDFGLAKISDTAFKEDIIDYKFDEKKTRHNRNFSCVGTVYYVAPEVIKKEGYGQEVDWWSLGVILFEMLAGYAPFCSKKTNEVCHKVMNFKKYLKFPSNCKASKECRDLIYKLVCNPDSRLGKKGSSEIKSHPFFKGINWLKIKEMKPPFIPQLSSDYDFKYFDNFPYLEPFIPIKEKVVRKRNEPEYTGYTFKGKENDPTDILSIINLIQKKKLEVEKEKEKEKKNISELNSFPNVEETNENKITQDSSNHNSININKENKTKEIKIIPIKVNPNYKTNTNKNTINIENNKYKKNNVINVNSIKKSKTSTNTIPKSKMSSNSSENQTKKTVNKIIKIDNTKPVKKKSSLLQNVSHSVKSGFKKVFSSSRSKEYKKEVKNK